MWVRGTKREGRTHRVLEAFPPNIYEILVFVLCPKELLIGVNRLVSFVRKMSEDGILTVTLCWEEKKEDTRERWRK